MHWLRAIEPAVYQAGKKVNSPRKKPQSISHRSSNEPVTVVRFAHDCTDVIDAGGVRCVRSRNVDRSERRTIPEKPMNASVGIPVPSDDVAQIVKLAVRPSIERPYPASRYRVEAGSDGSTGQVTASAGCECPSWRRR